METFAERLRTARAATGMSQQKMADRMLISKRTIEKWETGERVPSEYLQRFVLNELEEIAGKSSGAVYVRECQHNEIIDRETWEEVQAKMREKNEKPKPPLGYKRKNDKLIIDEEEAAVITLALKEMEESGKLSSDTEEKLRIAWEQHYKE